MYPARPNTKPFQAKDKKESGYLREILARAHRVDWRWA